MQRGNTILEQSIADAQLHIRIKQLLQQGPFTAGPLLQSRKQERFVKIIELTLPSYSRRESTSGAMYAGVPTVDLGFECSSDDCDEKTLQKKGVSN
jgi:hypothetical protein